jgi:hypothetical protein
MGQPATQNDFTEEWLLDAIRAVSFCIVEDGPVYAPILERLEHELELLRRQNDAVARAHRHLAEQPHRSRRALQAAT